MNSNAISYSTVNEISKMDSCERVPRWTRYKSELDNLTIEEFRDRTVANDQSVLLDVRTPAEFAEGTLDQAMNLNYLSPFLADKIEALDPSKVYYIFCRTGRRSLRVCMLMKNAGFRVFNLDNGIHGKV